MAALPPAPDMLIISLSDGGEQVLPYSANSRVPPADADAASSNARSTLKISLKVVAAGGARCLLLILLALLVPAPDLTCSCLLPSNLRDSLAGCRLLLILLAPACSHLTCFTSAQKFKY
jgi:hypothetical protein